MNNNKVSMQFRFVMGRHHIENIDGVAVCREFLKAALPKKQRNELDNPIYSGVELTASKHHFRGAVRILFVDPCKGLPIFDRITATPWLQSAAFKGVRPNWYRKNTICPLRSVNELIKNTFFPGEESLMGCVLFVSAKLTY